MAGPTSDRERFFTIHVPLARTAFETFAVQHHGKVVDVVADDGAGATYEDVLESLIRICGELITSGALLDYIVIFS